MGNVDTAPAPLLQDSRSMEKQEQALVDYVMERYDVADRFDRPFKNSALRHWQHFNSVLPQKWPYFSRWFEPETQNACSDVVEGMMSAVFSKEHPFDLVPMDDQDELQTELMRATMDYVLREKVKYKVTTYDHVQECVIYGNSVMKNYTEPRAEVTRRNVPVVGPMGLRMGMTEHQDYRLEVWPRSRVVSRFDCYPAATGNTIQSMPYFIERVIAPLTVIKAIGKMFGWHNTDKLDGFMSIDQMEHQARGTFDERNWDLYERLYAVGWDVRNTGADVGGNNIVKYGELLIYSEAPEFGEGGARMAVIGDRRWCLKPYPTNPFFHNLKQYSEIKFAPRDPQLWQAGGVPFLVENPQIKLNAISNAIGDILERTRTSSVIYGPSAGVRDPSDLDPYPQANVEVDGDPTKIIERKFADVPQGMWNYLTETRGSVQRAGGTLDYNQIMTGKQQGLADGAQTLGGMKTLMNAAGAAKSFRWRLAEETGISEGLNMIGQLIQQVLTTPQKIRIIGENKALHDAGFRKFCIVDPENIQGRYVFFAVGASMGYDNLTQAQLLVQWALGLKELPEAMKRLKQLPLAIEVGELSGVHSPGRHFMSDEELKAYIDQVPPPTPQKVLDSVKYDKIPADTQNELLTKVGLHPSQMGGSSPAEKHLATLTGHIIDANKPQPKPPARFGKK